MVIEAIKGGDGSRVREVLEAEPERAEERDEKTAALMLSHYYGVDAGGRSVPHARHRRSTSSRRRRSATSTGYASCSTRTPSSRAPRSVDDGTALHFAAFFNQPATAELLLERGAEPSGRVHVRGCPPAAQHHGRQHQDRDRVAGGWRRPERARQQGSFTPISNTRGAERQPGGGRGAARQGSRAGRGRRGKTAVDFAREQGHEDVAALLAGPWIAREGGGQPAAAYWSRTAFQPTS